MSLDSTSFLALFNSCYNNYQKIAEFKKGDHFFVKSDSIEITKASPSLKERAFQIFGTKLTKDKKIEEVADDWNSVTKKIKTINDDVQQIISTYEKKPQFIKQKKMFQLMKAIDTAKEKINEISDIYTNQAKKDHLVTFQSLTDTMNKQYEKLNTILNPEDVTTASFAVLAGRELLTISEEERLKLSAKDKVDDLIVDFELIPEEPLKTVADKIEFAITSFNTTKIEDVKEYFTNLLPLQLYGKNMEKLREDNNALEEYYLILTAIAPIIFPALPDSVTFSESENKPTGQNVINDRLKEMLSQNPGEPNAVYFERCLAEAMSTFVKDCINRPSNIFSYQQLEFHYTGIEVKEIFLKKATELYLKFLLDNPGKIKKIADRNKELQFLQQIKLAKPIDKKYYKDSYFPQELFVEIIEPEQSNLKRGDVSEDETKKNRLLKQIIDCANIPDDNIQKILTSAPKLSRKEVESLVRVKLLELILLVNQNFQFLPTAFLVKKYTSEHPSSTQLLRSFYAFEDDFKSLDFTMLMNLVSADGEEISKTAILKVHIPTIYGKQQTVQCTIVPFSLAQ